MGQLLLLAALRFKRPEITKHAPIHTIKHPSSGEAERQTRIVLLRAAYVYEFTDDEIMSDDAFDDLAKRSDPTIKTGKFDKWWRENFNPSTGQWVRSFPDLQGVKNLHERLQLL